MEERLIGGLLRIGSVKPPKYVALADVVPAREFAVSRNVQAVAHRAARFLRDHFVGIPSREEEDIVLSFNC